MINKIPETLSCLYKRLAMARLLYSGTYSENKAAVEMFVMSTTSSLLKILANQTGIKSVDIAPSIAAN